MSAARVTAIVLPLLVLAAEAAWLATPATGEPTLVRRKNDDALRANPPGIVLVGNSKAEWDIDAKLLAAELEYDRPIVTLWALGSSAPAWYAILEDRVYNQGYTPELFIVYGQLVSHLRTTTVFSERRAVEEQLDQDSPVLDAKVFKERGGALRRMGKRAAEVHDLLLATIRNRVVGAVFARGKGPGAAESAATTSLATVFGRGANLHAAAGPKLFAVEAVAANTAYSAMTADGTLPEDSLAIDLIALARSQGSKIVFVRAPLPAASAYTDNLSSEHERGFADLLAREGASWIDLRTLDLPPDAFRDPYHMRPQGAEVLTKALAARMKAAAVLSGGLASSRRVLVPTTARIGSYPMPPLTFGPTRNRDCGFFARAPMFTALSDDNTGRAGIGRATPFELVDAHGPLRRFASGKSVGKSCAGEFRHLAAGFEASPHPGGGAIEVRLPGAPSVPQQGGGETWWVYPGTATQWSFSEPWEGELQVFVEARSIGEGGGVLRLGEQAAPLQRAGRTWRATLNADEVRAPWLLAIEAAHDTWLALSQVTLGSDTPQRLVGAPPATLSAISSTFTAVTPPPIRAGTMIEDGGVAKIPLPGFEAVSDDATQALWGVPCSPVVVTSDGETWSTRHAPVRRVARTAKSSGHIGGFVYASLPGPHTLALDPRRTCDRSKRWIYPNDRVTFAQVPASARELRLGADLVRVVARSVGVPAELSVSVGVRGASPPPPVVHTLRVVQAREVFCLPIDPPMPPRANLDVAVRGDPAAFALLDQVQVGESEHMSCTPGAAP